MKRILQFPVLSVCLLLLVSCIQHSTVVRVEPGGGGKIFVRNYYSPELNEVAGKFGIEITEDITKPTAEKLKKEALEFGKDVRFLRKEWIKNDDDWNGYLAVFEFDDINLVSLNAQSALPEIIRTQVEKSTNRPAAKNAAGNVTFQLSEGLLKIDTDMGRDALSEFHDSVAGKERNPESKEEETKPSGQLAKISELFSGMRIGYYVRIDGGIAESTASHVQEEYITMIDLDVPRFLTDPEFMAFVDNAANHSEATPEANLEVVASEIEAMKAEMAPSVTVKFN